jgi:hypothetical protein
MAYYAKISNEEFTVSERARLMEARDEKGAIEANNMASAEYEALKTQLESLSTSAELERINNEIITAPIDADLTSLYADQKTEQNRLNEERTAVGVQMSTKKAEGTEALTAEITALNTSIANALCRVTDMYSGADEIVMVPGDSSSINAQIFALEESKKNIDSSLSEEENLAELIIIQNSINTLQSEKYAIPQVEFDNTVYWEGYYGGCKRTSYNTRGGVHQLGGTPFRKNYAGVGYIYDPVRDAFYGQQPFASWILNEDTCYWAAPVAKPEGMDWYWKEDTTEWVDYIYINPDNNQPYPSWTWDTTNGGWVPPVEKPSGPFYRWDEENQQWI